MPKFDPNTPIGGKKGGLKPFKVEFVQHDGEYEYDTESIVWARTSDAADNKARRFRSKWWDEMRPCRDLSGKVDPDAFEEVHGWRVVQLGAVRELKTVGDLVECIGEID